MHRSKLSTSDEILPRLPTKMVIRFKSLSKTWLSLISQHASLIAAKHTAAEKPGSIFSGWYRTDKYDPRLFFLGHNESNLVEIDTSFIYKKTPDYLVLVGSCNGLVCLKLDYDKTHDLVLWNPATREVNYLLTDEKHFTKYALGYDARSGVDKLVRLKQSGRLFDAQIFSKKSGRWRNLNSSTGVHPCALLLLEEGKALTVDGAIYCKSYSSKVLSFDLSKEEFGLLDGPASQLDYELIRWKGSLGAVFVKPGGAEIEFWLKNKDCNNSDDSGWTKISNIQVQPSLGPLTLVRAFNGQIILKCNSDNSNAKKQILYDLVTNEKRELEPGCLEKVWYYYISEHCFTLISPN